jgi:carbamoyltransferase
MLVVAPVKESIRKPVDADKHGLEKLSQERSVVPAVTHVDYSARVQTVDDERNPRLTALLRKFKELTGCPVLINTSFNVRGEPIVCDPANALRCFWGTEMDVLVLEDFVICRRTQTNAPVVDRKEYLSAFALD